MKSGFTLIELSIGILLSGIIITVLYNSFFITHRIVDIADNFIQTDFRAAIISNQLEKDLDSVLIPLPPDVSKTGTQQKTANPTGKKEEVAPEKQPKPIEHVFYSTNNPEGGLEILTFLTNNPVKVYEKAKNAKAKPRFVRVVYRLVAQQAKEHKSYTLLRQESNELELKAFDLLAAKPIRAYELATNIKNVTIEYMFPVQKKQAQQPAKATPTAATSKEKKTKSEKPKPEFKTVNVWDIESQKTPQEQPKIPQFITVSLELWNNQHQQEYKFTFKYEIPTFAALMQPPKQSKAPAPAPAPTPATQATPSALEGPSIARPTQG